MGVISRVDRNAPYYQEAYEDFNINYYQANMNLSGGISGSPALAPDGSVIGLVSGGGSDGESICFLLPLWPVLDALKFLKKGLPISRGDIQCRFHCKPFNECRRLGVGPWWEEQFRSKLSGSSGMLVAKTIVPHGPASGRIMVGDVLLEVDNRMPLHFADMERTMNANVGKPVRLRLLRDGKVITVDIQVNDLHEITPRRLLSIGGSYFHDLSYLQAVAYGVRREGVYVAESADPFLIGDGDPGWMIQKAGGQDVTSLDEFLQALLSHPRRSQRLSMTYSHLENLPNRKTNIFTLDVPNGITLALRDERTGIWNGRTFGLPCFEQLSQQIALAPRFNPSLDSTMAEIVPSMVHVESRAYMSLDGIPPIRRHGMGVVVDVKLGLIITCRSIVPHKACNISITIGSSAIVKGRAVFWHPHHYYAIVKYDPSRVGGKVSSARLSSRRVDYGEHVKFVGFTQPDRILYGDVKVGSATVGGPITEDNYWSRYCLTNADLFVADKSAGATGGSGLFVAPGGTVLALWLPVFGGVRGSQSFGIRTPSMLNALTQLRQGVIPKPQVFPAEMEVVSPATARVLGVPAELIDRAVVANSRHPELYQVRKLTCGLKGNTNDLFEGDIIVSIDGQTCTDLSDFDIPYRQEAEVVRGGQIKTISLAPVQMNDLETSQCIAFCGAYIQKPHLAIRRRLDDIPSEIYVSHIVPGSPADRYFLPTESFITAINGERVKDLDSFISLVTQRFNDTARCQAASVPCSQTGLDFTVVVTTANGNKVKVGIVPDHDYFPLTTWSASVDK